MRTILRILAATAYIAAIAEVILDKGQIIIPHQGMMIIGFAAVAIMANIGAIASFVMNPITKEYADPFSLHTWKKKGYEETHTWVLGWHTFANIALQLWLFGQMEGPGWICVILFLLAPLAHKARWEPRRIS